MEVTNAVFRTVSSASWALYCGVLLLYPYALCQTARREMRGVEKE